MGATTPYKPCLSYHVTRVRPRVLNMAGQSDDRLRPSQLEKATKAIQVLAGLDIPDSISKRSSSDDGKSLNACVDY